MLYGRTMVLVAVLALLAAPAAAQAQGAAASPPTVVVPPNVIKPAVPPPASRTKTAAPVPSTRLLGVPVTADAPVSPSYDGTAYKTLGGQAETGQDAISGQVMQPTGTGPR